MNVLRGISRYISPRDALVAVGSTALAAGTYMFPGTALALGTLGAGVTAGYGLASAGGKQQRPAGATNMKPDVIQEAIQDATGVDMALAANRQIAVPADYAPTIVGGGAFPPVSALSTTPSFILTTPSGDASAARALSAMRHLQGRLAREQTAMGGGVGFPIGEEVVPLALNISRGIGSQLFEQIKQSNGLGIAMIGVGAVTALGPGITLLASDTRTMSTAAKVIMGVILAAGVIIVIFGVVQLMRRKEKDGDKNDTVSSWEDELDDTSAFTRGGGGGFSVDPRLFAV